MNRCANKKRDNGYNNNAYINDAYFIGSEDEPIEMKSDSRTNSSRNLPIQNPEEHNYAAIYDHPLSTNQSAVILKFPEASAAEKGSEGGTSSIYQPLDSGVGASIYQHLNSGPKFSEASPGKNSEGNATSIYQQLKNDPKVSEAWTEKSITEGADIKCTKTQKLWFKGLEQQKERGMFK